MTEIVIPRANLLVNGEWFANGDHVETAGITVERASSGGSCRSRYSEKIVRGVG